MIDNITIISGKWVIPILPKKQILEDHSIIVDGHQIKEILATSAALKKHPNARHLEHSSHVIMPGLINAHTHSPMNLLKGFANDLPLMEWLNNHIWPAESKWADRNFVRDGSELAIAEMINSGTTCFSDMYFFPDETARVAQELGIRAIVGAPILDFPTVWANNIDDYFSRGLEVHDEVRSLSLVDAAFAPHSPYAVSNEALQKVQTYADELNVPIHMHIHETADEIKQGISQFSTRPLSRLNQLGLLNPRMIAVHMTQLTDDEIQLVAETGISVVHCPASNAKLASDRCRVESLIDAGVNVCIGTDGAASNNDLDMLSEIRLCALTAKLGANDASVVDAWTALEMATINAATAINLQHSIGSLEVGKAADLIAIDLNHISTQPVYDVAAQIVYACSREQVSDVWVNGKQLLRNHSLTEIDTQVIIDKAQHWAEKIKHS